MIYHDVLSLFVAAESYEYIRAMGYKGHPIVPLNGLIESTLYTKYMVRMRPEMMPLNAYLKQDLNESVDRHVNRTYYLPDSHPNKFLKQKPKTL